MTRDLLPWFSVMCLRFAAVADIQLSTVAGKDFGFDEFSVFPIHIHLKDTAGHQSFRRSVFPFFRKGRQQTDIAFMALQKHLDNTGGGAVVAIRDLFLLNHVVINHANLVIVDEFAGLLVPSSGAMAHLMFAVATCATLLHDIGKYRFVFFIIFYPVQVVLEAGWVNLFFRIHDVGVFCFTAASTAIPPATAPATTTEVFRMNARRESSLSFKGNFLSI
jgi:hypothetical protein